MNYLYFIYINVCLSSFIVMMTSCAHTSNTSQKSLNELLNKEILFPSNLSYIIIDTPIKYDIDDYDYKIITYIDSSECTSCMMKLYQWENTMNELKSANQYSSIGFCMIIGSTNNAEIKDIIHADNFPYTIAFDPDHNFMDINNLPSQGLNNTFLLNFENRIIAIGNPIINPKIKKLYKKLSLTGRVILSLYLLIIDVFKLIPLFHLE